MAKVQTRRTISFNRDLYELVHLAAAQCDESASEYVQKAVRTRLARGGRRRLPQQRYDGRTNKSRPGLP